MKKKINIKPKVETLLRESYFALIKNSVDTKMFQQFYVKLNGRKEEVLHNGDRSCAYYVSSILVIFKLIKDVQLTVHRTIADMKKTGWKEIKRPRKGCVIVWKEKKYGKNNPHKHIGFYLGKNIAISNNSSKGTPIKHPYKTYNGREIDSMFWHSKLEK